MKDNIRLYAAPMEGLTGFAWRKAHAEVFGGADKYFTPFVVANQTHKFKTKEIRDLTQEEDNLVPQIITDKAEHFIWAAGELTAMGFSEINLNLGCPGSTVVTRNKGAGLLRMQDRLDEMLDEIYTALPDLKISIKTRIGFADKDEWPTLLEMFNRYPVSELIVHPRLREEYYKGRADRELFGKARVRAKMALVYNGDVEQADDEAFSYGCSVMAGRGLLADPALFRRVRKTDAKAGAATAEELKRFHECLLDNYSTYMSGDGPVIHHMKSMWIYFEKLFDYSEKDMKKLRKAKDMNEYLTAASAVMKKK